MAMLSEVIKRLEAIQEEHGDLPVYEMEDVGIFKFDIKYGAEVRKLYFQKWEEAEWMKGYLSESSPDTPDQELYNVDLNKPIFKAVVL